VLGWLLGMMSRSGGARWRRVAAEERATREGLEARLEGANAKIAELERERPAVVTEKRVVSEEPVATETAAERRADRTIVEGEEDIP
jgi:hypothetical protein